MHKLIVNDFNLISRQHHQSEDAFHHSSRPERLHLLGHGDPGLVPPPSGQPGERGRVPDAGLQVVGGRDSGSVARGGRRLARLRHSQRAEARLLLPLQPRPSPHRLLREGRRGRNHQGRAQVSAEDQRDGQLRRHPGLPGALGRAVGLPQRVAAPPVPHDLRPRQGQRHFRQGAGLRDLRALGQIQLHGIQRDSRHV